MRIVVPRALHYHYLHPLWSTFLETLGHEVLVTPPTDRDVLARGLRLSHPDICLPLKAYLGHALSAVPLGDAVFVPRLVSLHPSRYFCPKFLALPDVVRAKLPGANVKVVEINAKKGPGFTRSAFVSLAKALGNTGAEGEKAFDAGERALEEHEAALLADHDPAPADDGEAFRIALVGHPYTVEDETLSSGVKRWLLDRGVRVVAYESVPEAERAGVDTDLFRDIYWECAHAMTRAALFFLASAHLDGMILLSAFGCGPDSFIADIVGRRARARGVFPFVRLLVDEHTAREGLLTRLEAFMDMAEAFRNRRTRQAD
jgi:predicted nucleotide-binding protein (sugar kinase/HSP70/actin superfamily)